MIVTLSTDFLFTSRIATTAAEHGLEAYTARDPEQFKQEVLMRKPSLVVIDLSAKSFNPFEAVRFIKDYDHSSYGAKPPRLIGFYSHVETEVQEKAQREGINEAMPRSKFVRELNSILKELKDED